MKVLVLNSGSSSIKFQLFRSDDWRVLASGAVARIGEALGEFKGQWRDDLDRVQGFTVHLPIPDHREGLEPNA